MGISNCIKCVIYVFHTHVYERHPPNNYFFTIFFFWIVLNPHREWNTWYYKRSSKKRKKKKRKRKTSSKRNGCITQFHCKWYHIFSISINYKIMNNAIWSTAKELSILVYGERKNRNPQRRRQKKNKSEKRILNID